MRRAFLVVAVLSATSGVRAEERTTRRFSLKASPAAECPAIETFSRRVLARTSRAALASSGNADVAFALSVEVEPEGAAGALEVVENGARSVRNVRGASCEEVVDALALIAAVTLDPEASTRPIAIEEPAQQPAPEPTAAEPARASPLPPVGASRRPPPLEPEASRRSWRLGAGVRGSLTEGLAPDPLVGVGAFVSALLPGEGSSLEPSFFAGVTWARSGEYDASVGSERLGTAQFRWLAGDVIACPLRLPAVSAFAVRTCGGFEAGRLTGKGRAAQNSAEESATWLAMSASLKLDWMLFELLQIDVMGGGFVSLTRDEFFFEPAPGSSGTEGVVVHEIPAAGLRGSIGVGVVLP